MSQADQAIKSFEAAIEDGQDRMEALNIIWQGINVTWPHPYLERFQDTSFFEDGSVVYFDWEGDPCVDDSIDEFLLGHHPLCHLGEEHYLWGDDDLEALRGVLVLKNILKAPLLEKVKTKLAEIEARIANL